METSLLRSLPPHLAERTRVVTVASGGEEAAAIPTAEASEGAPAGEMVLYWMRTAVRGHENPALDVALALGRSLERPVYVYHGLDERYPYASDRHHTFILEGARDVAAELDARGIGYGLHVARPGHRTPALRQLALRASVVVTEDMPVAPLYGWTRGLAKAVTAPVLEVDTACVVPMGLVSADAVDRAFLFRRATRDLRRERLSQPWPETAPTSEDPGQPYEPDDLPFEPLLSTAAKEGRGDDGPIGAELDLAAIVGACEIDHGVGPIPHTRGGSAAGYARWHAFRQLGGLDRYARDRNAPLRNGISRMSPYLHYGMVSPLRIAREAREAQEQGSAGAKKYLDELLIWREVAYAFCWHRPAPGSLDAVPEWARDTLEAHADDERPELASWETLARARTGDPLWDAAQLSLLRQGELHNNVRMTWGKAFLGWTPTPARALELTIDLNHRYALDGRDPASYGGILWCYGTFDRPFEPPRPIRGTVRGRDSGWHARRLDPERYRAQVAVCPYPPAPSVLVLGSGLAGLACARTLHDAGLAVEVLDKGRGPGGRLATREQDGYQFDYGAQFFTARDRRFRQLVDAWCEDGVAAPWPAEIVTLRSSEGVVGRRPGERFVGTPTMRQIARHLADDLAVRQRARVSELERRDGRWHVRLDDGEMLSAEALMLTAPAPQALDLLAGCAEASALAEALAPLGDESAFAACHAVLVRFREPLSPALSLPDGPPGEGSVEGAFDGAFVEGSPLAWIAREASKPGRDSGASWVLHSTPEWSEEHLDDEREAVAEALLAAFAETLPSADGASLPEVEWVRVHRWRYARVLRPLERDCLFDPSTNLGYAGDACRGSRVEDAFLSGVALGGALLRHLHQQAERQLAREEG